MTKAKRIGVQMHCGECLHYTTQRLYEAPCAQLGVEEEANAPACFSPDTKQLTSISTDLIHSLGKILRGATSGQQRLLAHAVEAAAELAESTRFKFGQPVFICLGKDVLSHYFKAYVVGLSPDGQIILSSSFDGGESQSSLLLFPDSIMTKSEFEAHKTWLIQNDQIMLRPDEAERHGLPIAGYYVPNSTKRETIAAFEEYVPPTMETAPASWYDKTAENTEGTSKKLRKLRKNLPVTQSPASVRDLDGLEVEHAADGSATVAL